MQTIHFPPMEDLDPLAAVGPQLYQEKHPMADKIKFTGAILRSFGRKEDGHAVFSASLTNAVCDAMGWTEIPDCLSSAHLSGELNGLTSCVITPSDRQLSKHAVELQANTVESFEVVRLELEGKRDKGDRLELRFKVRFADPTGCRKLEEYKATVGEGKSSVTVGYVKQEQLPGIDPDAPHATEEQRQAVLQED